MSKPTLTVLALAATLLAACTPPPPVPPPQFTPNPPYAPTPVDPYGQTQNPTTPESPTAPGIAANPAGTPPTDAYGQPIQPAPPITNPPVDPPTVRPGEYPLARRTANPNEVISPYEPYNVVNIEGFSSGQLARDPHNKKIFRIP